MAVSEGEEVVVRGIAGSGGRVGGRNGGGDGRVEDGVFLGVHSWGLCKGLIREDFT